MVPAWMAMLAKSLRDALGPAWRWRLRGSALFSKERVMSNDVKDASEALVSMPLPEMLGKLGLAVAEANKQMAALKDTPNSVVMTVQEATVELAIAISVSEQKDVQGQAQLGLKAFSVNASYARSFGFKEEASSRITMKLAVVPARA